ncbi:unnamed protein product (macronuclear) [Paramecium tetraurelia]|uniref:C3H1-type domain-containing protein n=1 Tax=Paramecium tetraurelia TaxID=5888 RepID=A0CN00_PARTE|nr:uncharacterized protein GSPATT00008608001 [Paramecium tetraurelia]CAK72167.1 unnamed protein product [Paramecium tetraurelia]|eukprot:XP_001439564.1 hypothetical protein (macronuclear) [Paramecium tetraurelia strain d4-2]
MIQNSIIKQQEDWQFTTILSDFINTNEEEFEIGVKPKSRRFSTSVEKYKFIEEYTKKKKTELCKNFTLKGSCKFGKECSYAHGCSELLPKAHLHQNYKTRPCKNFMNDGWCNYGSRCQYIHPENSIIKKKTHKLISQDKQAQQKICSNNQNLAEKIILLYSELLQKLNIRPQFSISNLPRLNCFKKLGMNKISSQSNDSD